MQCFFAYFYLPVVVNSQKLPHKKDQAKANPARSASETETLAYCNKSFVAEKVMVNNVDIVNRILDLETKRNEDSCMNYAQIQNISVLKYTDEDAINLILFEKNALTNTDRQLPIDAQRDKIYTNEKYQQTNEYAVRGNTIYTISKFDSSEQLLGDLQ